MRSTHKDNSPPNQAALDAACLALLAALALAAWLPLLTKIPLPGGDEPGFVAPAAHWARHGTLGTDIYSGQLPGMERHVYWQPPVYFLCLGMWLKIFGVGLTQARLFSVACGLVVVLCVYRLARFWATSGQALGVGTLCAVSVWVGVGARVARMDMLCTAWVLLSAASYVTALRRAERPFADTVAALVGTGVFAGLALLTHPLGVVAAVSVAAHMAWRRRPAREWAATFVPVGVCLLGWLAYVGQDVGAFRAQMGAQAARRAQYAEPPFWFWFVVSKLHLPTLLVLLGGGVGAAVLARRLRDGAEFIVGLTGAMLAAATYGRLSFYFADFVPLLCVTLAVCWQVPSARRWAGAGLVVAIGIELLGIGHDLRQARRENYGRLTAAVRAAIPPGKRVFLSYSYLSPYFALEGRNPLRVAAPVPLPPGESLDSVIGGCDYLVVPSPLIGTGLRQWIDGKTPVATVADGRLVVYRLH